MNADVLTTNVENAIAVITLGSAKRIYFDEEMGDSLTAALEELAGNPAVRVVVVTGGAPGYFIRHFSISSLLRLAEAIRASGREWPDNATSHGAFFDGAMALCESMSKPVIAAISGTCLTGGFEFAEQQYFKLPTDLGTGAEQFLKRDAIFTKDGMEVSGHQIEIGVDAIGEAMLATGGENLRVPPGVEVRQRLGRAAAGMVVCSPNQENQLCDLSFGEPAH